MLGPLSGSMGAGAPVLMFDLSRLTWLDYSEMRWHPQVNASLSLMTFMLHQLDWTIECEDKKIVDLVEENLRLVWTQLVRGISQSYWAGYSPMVLEWENTREDKGLHLQGQGSAPRRGQRPLERGSSPPIGRPRSTAIGSSRRWRCSTAWTRSGWDTRFPRSTPFWYPVLRENNDYTGRKLLKAAFAPVVLLASHPLVLQSLLSERFGEPVPVGRYPGGEEFAEKGPEAEDDRRVTSKQVIERALLQLKSGVSVSLPSDRDESASGAREYEYDIEYLESQMRGADFERYLERLDGKRSPSPSSRRCC